jgi:hypothetical protein
VVGREKVGHLLIELAEVILDHARFFQRELQQPTANRVQRRTRLEGIAQLIGRGTQARGRECRKGGRIGSAVRQRLQHAAGTDAEQVRHEAGHLDVRFLEQGLQPILELDAITGHLVLAAHHGAPEPLLNVGHAETSRDLWVRVDPGGPFAFAAASTRRLAWPNGMGDEPLWRTRRASVYKGADPGRPKLEGPD